ncbi:MAG: hypothetical protein JXB85_00150 [Anaerolineales bacterium]|nr:hypothetical protein [Anaerolineales bacterium]
MKSRLALFPSLLVLLAACNPSPTSLPTSTVVPTPMPGVLYVDPGRELGEISPYLYGSNYGPMHAVPMEMMPVALDAGVTALRFPGGAWGDVVDIQFFQVDQFLSFCEQMNAIPTISVRLLGGTPEAAAELVRYTNLEKDYGVVFWSIGNEPTLYESQTGEPYDTLRFNREWRSIAEAMLAVDPDIQIMGPELHQWGTSPDTTPKDSAGRDWMTEFLIANGDLVDVVTVHRYPLYRAAGQAVTFEELRLNTREWTDLVTYLRGLIWELTGRDLPIAFTEVNSSPTGVMGGDTTPDSFYNAIWYADVLGQLGQQRVLMVNQWVLSQRSTGLGLIYGNQVRPTLYVFQLYSHFGSRLVQASSGISDVTVYAALRNDGTLTIMVINLTDREQSVPLRVAGRTPVEAEVWLLDASHNAEGLGLQPLPADGTLILPPQSATLFVFEE